MNELDKHLTTALQAMNRATQQRLDSQARVIQRLQQTVSQIQAEQRQFGQALQDLGNMSATLPPLLTRLNSLFASK